MLFNPAIWEWIKQSREKDMLFGPNATQPFQFFPGSITKIVDKPWWKALIGSEVKHGGSPIQGSTFDPQMLGRGEPGNTRPLGNAFYTSNQDNIANRYLKYAPTKEKALNLFDIVEDAVVFPKGSLWHDMSTTEQEAYRKISERATSVFKEKGLIKENQHWIDGIRKQGARELLKEAGIDALAEKLPFPDTYEIGWYNPEAIIKK